MTNQSNSFPHVFLDTNALVKLLLSITRHIREKITQKTLIRVLMEKELLHFAVSEQSINKALGIIYNERSLGYFAWKTSISELKHSLKKGWIVVIEENILGVVENDEIRKALYEKLARYWYDLLSPIDSEDAEIMKKAACFYAGPCLIKTMAGYYTPSYGLIISDDKHVRSMGYQLNNLLIQAIKELSDQELPIKLYKTSRLISIINWNEFKDLLKQFFL